MTNLQASTIRNVGNKRHSPRWLILLIDLLISVASVTFAYLLRFNFDTNDKNFDDFEQVLLYVAGVRLLLFIGSRSYAGIIRYTSTKDAVRIILVVMVGSLVYALTNIAVRIFGGYDYIMPMSVIGIDFFVSVFLMVAFRLVVKTLYVEATTFFKHEKRVIILGIDQNALTLKRTLYRTMNEKYKVEAFIDLHNLNAKKQLDGVTVYTPVQVPKILKKKKIDELIVSENVSLSDSYQNVVDLCLNQNIKVSKVPPVSDWINGELSSKQIKKINIEDLLGRAPIVLDEEKIKTDIKGKTVLVTGAAGSIGSEIVLQLTRFKPSKIVALDQAESPLYDLELSLQERHNFFSFEIVIADITKPERMDFVFKTFKPEVVYHAAAYKHVPMMENNPAEAVSTNIFGTKIIADISVKYKVKKFVMISTDKAVNPTNIMGASKRIAEIYIQTLNKEADIAFITTRFGNVLGSNGSVIPRFKKQIEEGGPITVTHPDVTRFFMTIPEACRLVLQAGVLGKGGEIFIFDMGASVKIVDLAKKMIKLSGLELGKDIHLNFTGLRPGEKLYEELLNDKENTFSTSHKKIMAAKVRHYGKDILFKIEQLIDLAKEYDNFRIVKQMKDIVPEFTSKNSIYESLDKEQLKS